MAWIELNATNPAPPAGAQNVHFRADTTHLGTSADPEPVSAYVPPFTGDAGSGGASGLVPAPAAADAAANKFLHANGAFELLPMVVRFVIPDGSAGTDIALNDAADRPGVVTKCTLVITASDATTALTFAIKKSGTDVFSADPTVAAGAGAGSISTFTTLVSSPLAVAAGDIFTMDITSGSPSWKFIAKLE